MGKRKHSDSDTHIRRKIRKLKKRLRRYSSSSESNNERQSESSLSPSCHFDYYSNDDYQLKSTVTVPLSDTENNLKTNSEIEKPLNENVPQNNTEPSVPSTSLSADILEALGDPKPKEEEFGTKVPNEISERWGRILQDGLSKERKQELMEHKLIPENFKLLKAPVLNSEIASVLSETVKNRDKILERSQNHLGKGIAGLANLASSLIDGSLEKIGIIKRLSDVTQCFLDLHHENTKSRRKCIITSLDKKFTTIIQDVKRDDYLFGANLGEKIKASKSAEKSGLQIKRTEVPTASTSRKYTPMRNQGNWKGPSRHQGQRLNRQGGQYKSRYQPPPPRRPQFPNERPAPVTKPGPRTNKS